MTFFKVLFSWLEEWNEPQRHLGLVRQHNTASYLFSLASVIFKQELWYKYDICGLLHQILNGTKIK